MPRLTKGIVDSLQCEGPGPAYLWDASLAGFGIKALGTGKKKYVVKYRVGGGGRAGVQRWLTLGIHGSITCDQARSLAQQALAAVARGEDPQSEKFKQRTLPTLQDVWERFERDYLPQRKARTRAAYAAQWRDVLGPRFGRVNVSEVTRSDVDRLHKGLKATPYQANRVLALSSRLMSLAEAWNWRDQGTNPCRFIQRFQEQPRSRYLSGHELERVGEALHELAEEGIITPEASNAIRLLLLTGARLNELLTAKLGWVEWDRRVIALPDSKTGKKPIYLSDAAILILREQQKFAERKESEYIFPGRSPGKHMINLRDPWVRVCESAGVQGTRLHDLRHTAASIAVGQGATLPIIGRLLGHSQAQTTLRYAHVDTDPALAAANLIADVVGKKLQRRSAMDPGQGSDPS